MYKEERDVLEKEVREIDECDMEEFDTPDRSEKMVAILGVRWWPHAAKQEGDKIIIFFLCNTWKLGSERPTVGDVSTYLE